MAGRTPGRTGPAQPVPSQASRRPLRVLGCSLAVFVAAGLPAHWQVTGRLLGLAGSPKGSWTSRLVVGVTTLGDDARRRVVRGAGITIAFLVGASRIVLAVHWPTDVIAGWALGTALAPATPALGRRPTGPGPGSPPPTEPPR
jgi:membrane-associated phospholipid phosphatase